MKKLFSLFVSIALLLFIANPVLATPTYYQGFEDDTSGWFDTNSDWFGTITKVNTGTNGITSSEGNSHAIFEGDEESAPFSRFDEYRDTWSGSYITEIDIYLDPTWASGTGFDYSVASSGSDGNHQRDYIFHVTKDSSTGRLIVGASNNTNFAPREDLETIKSYSVTSAGWYTFQHVFYEDRGALAVDLNLINSDGEIVFIATKYSALDTIPAEVGGNRYAWFTFINIPDGIAVDSHELILSDKFTTPTNKDECKKDGWMTFNNPSFNNQGECVSFVQSKNPSKPISTLETLRVSSLTPTRVQSNTILETGKTYLIEASGVYSFASVDRPADAEFWYNPDTHTWNEESSNPLHNLDLMVNESSQDWLGSNDGVNYNAHTFSPDHTYRLYVTGNGNPISFYIYDSSYDWNDGSLLVTIKPL